MKENTKRTEQRGFTLIIVIMLIAILAMIGVALLNLLNLDRSLVGQTRRSAAARAIADGGTMEVINYADLNNVFPQLGSPNLSTLFKPTSASVFAEAADDDDYQSRVSLMRIVPIAESSQGLSRAVVYEIVTRSRFDKGEASAEIRTEIYRPINWEGQSIMPRKHYR